MCERKRRTRERVYEREMEGGGWGERSMRIVENMCYEIRRAEACVDESYHHTLVNAGKRDSV